MGMGEQLYQYTEKREKRPPHFLMALFIFSVNALLLSLEEEEEDSMKKKKKK